MNGQSSRGRSARCAARTSSMGNLRRLVWKRIWRASCRARRRWVMASTAGARARPGVGKDGTTGGPARTDYNKAAREELLNPFDVRPGAGVYFDPIPDADEEGHVDRRPGLQFGRLRAPRHRVPAAAGGGLHDLQLYPFRQFHGEDRKSTRLNSN